ADTVNWIDVTIPPDLDDPSLSMPVIDPLAQRVFASPALGWPTRHGTEAMAATGSLGMGDDRPFQDRGRDSDVDPRTLTDYGSGLPGRSASLSLGARATPPAKDTSSDAPVFFRVGRKVVFDRPQQLPLVCPPARHLTPTSARIVTPVAEDLHAA